MSSPIAQAGTPPQGGTGPPEGIKWIQAASVLLTGLGVGWLTGLSVSPVVASVVAGLVGIAGAAVAGLQGLRRAGADAVDARPAALLVVGVALGAPAGMLARTHHVFETRTFEAREATAGARKVDEGGLFGSVEKDCTYLRAIWLRGDKGLFVKEFGNSASLPRARELAAQVPDPEALNTVMEALCTSR